MKVSEQINLGMPILCSKCNQDLFLCQCPQEPFPIPRLSEQNERQLLSDQIELLKARDESLTALVKDCLEFLEQPEHEIVNVYSEDHWEESIYCGLSLGWEEQRDALLARAKELIGS